MIHRNGDRKIKCVIWDLDHTIWKGVLSEDEEVLLRPGIRTVIEALDQRGLIQSISSKNNEEDAIRKLKELGLDEYFLYPQINWNPKSCSVKAIRESLNIAYDAIAVVDDSPYELEEINFSFPEVLCIRADQIADMLKMEILCPAFITEDSSRRRLLYRLDLKRKEYEETFGGTNERFLASLKMDLIISKVTTEDLQRAEELTVRTHQLNTTGYIYSYEDLISLKNSDSHHLWISELNDKFGTYGKIGISLISCQNDIWVINLILMSCRVMSRGIGTVLLVQIMNHAKKANVRLQAEFVENGRNRMMLVTYKMMGFVEVCKDGDKYLLEHDLEDIPKTPDFINVTTPKYLV